MKKLGIVNSKSETSNYKACRNASSHEGRASISHGRNPYPLVVQAASSSDVPFLKDFLAAHSSGLREDIYAHGAVLLRGFKVRSPADFEDALSAIQGFRPMNGYFMSEQGRDPVKGTGYVDDTSTFFISGGDFRFGGIHSENYYSPDVPQFQCLCCLKTPWIGGETALFHMANAYCELRERLAPKVETEPFVASVFPLASVAERYQLSENEVEEFLAENKAELVEWGGGRPCSTTSPVFSAILRAASPRFRSTCPWS